MKKLLGITLFLVLVYVALLRSDENADLDRMHFLIGQRLGLYGILSLAAGLLIITGGIDLSMGSLVCLCSTVFGLLIVKHGWSVPAAFLAMLLLGMGAGLTNGLLVTKLRLQPFMVTLCGLFIFRSIARWLTNDAKIEELAAPLRDLSAFFEGSLGGVPVYLIIFAGAGHLRRHFFAFQRGRPLFRRPGQQRASGPLFRHSHGLLQDPRLRPLLAAHGPLQFLGRHELSKCGPIVGRAGG